jgi:hypothetical protein
MGACREPAAASRKLLVTGCGRSGTRYVTFVLRRLGLDVRHEEMGRDGTVSWCLAVTPDSVPWGPSAKAAEFDQVFLQLRHPLNVISSCMGLRDESWSFISAHIDCPASEPKLLRAAKYWVHWNELGEQIATWRYRIEELPEVFDEFCCRLDVGVERSVLDHIPSDVNTRRAGRAVHLYDELCELLRVDTSSVVRRYLVAKQESHEEVTWECLRALSPEWELRVRAKAREYGYAA